MIYLIELTIDGTEEKFLINPDVIESIFKNESGSTVYIDENVQFIVKENYEQIRNMLMR